MKLIKIITCVYTPPAVAAIALLFFAIANHFTEQTAPAWIQALGTIAAVLVAIWVPAWQKEQDRKEKKAEESEKRYTNALAVHDLVRHQINIFTQARQDLKPNNFIGTNSKVERALQLLEGCHSEFETVQINSFGNEHIYALLALKENSRYASYICETFRNPTRAIIVGAPKLDEIKAEIGKKISKLEKIELDIVELYEFIEDHQ